MPIGTAGEGLDGARMSVAAGLPRSEAIQTVGWDDFARNLLAGLTSQRRCLLRIGSKGWLDDQEIGVMELAFAAGAAGATLPVVTVGGRA